MLYMHGKLEAAASGGVVRLVLFPHRNLRCDREQYLFEECSHDQMRVLCKGTIPELARPAPHNPLLNTGNGELIYVAQI